jgi:hypothetical protein
MGRPHGKHEFIITINWSCSHESHIVTLCRLPDSKSPSQWCGTKEPLMSASSVLYPRIIPHRCKEGPRAIAPHGPYVCQCLSYAILAQAENSEHISHWRAAKMAGSGISPGTEWSGCNPLLLDRWGKDTKGCGPFCMSLDVIGLGRSNSVGSLQNSWPRTLLIAF